MNESGNEGYWADEQDWNDGYWATEELYYKDEDGYFHKKSQGKKEKRKARMMKAKEVNQEMAKVSPNTFSLKLHQLQLSRIKINMLMIFLQHQVLDMDLFLFLKLTQYVLMY